MHNTMVLRKFLIMMLLITAAVCAPRGAVAQEDDGFTVGGALRYNYYVKSYDEGTKNRGGDIALDTFRFNIDGTYADITLSAEYRFYSGYNMLHHGYLAYDFTDKTQVQLGVHQVPFGIQTYASHSWFFSMMYYLGLEDDYDAGIKLIHDGGPWDVKIAYYKNSEGNYTGNSVASARYSYDVVPTGNGWSDQMETNQFNIRGSYTLAHAGGETELGLSAQAGQLYNTALDESGTHTAFAAHSTTDFNRFNLQLSAVRVDHSPEIAPGGDDSFVAMGAYDAPYKVASKGNLFGVGVAYGLPVDIGPISKLTFYNDWSTYQKDEDAFYDSYHNITGVMVTAGKVYTYIDLANGINDPWVGGPWNTGLAEGVDADWETRFNINVGYYF